MENKLTYGEFEKLFPTEDACLEALKNYKYPDGITCKKCGLVTPHYKIKKYRAYACEFCGSHVYPLAGTIFQHSRTPLRFWLHAIFLMVHSRSGTSAKTLERHLGVTYKTAWRMFRLIRTLMTEDSDDLLLGIIECDCTWIGGKSYFRGKDWWPNFKDRPQVAVFGMVERGGRVRTKIVDEESRYIVTREIKENIDPKSYVLTDGHQGYWDLHKEGFMHNSIAHQIQYVDPYYNEIHTQTIEGFWGQMKRGIKGVYRHVSLKYLPLYMDEYTFRYNHRKEGGKMFEILLRKAVKV